MYLLYNKNTESQEKNKPAEAGLLLFWVARNNFPGVAVY